MSCSASGAWASYLPTSGSRSTGPLMTTSTISLACAGPGGTITGQMSVAVESAGNTRPVGGGGSRGGGLTPIALLHTQAGCGSLIYRAWGSCLAVDIVARAVGGLPELLSGVTGCRLVEGGEPASFAAAVRAVLEAGEHPQLPERYNIRRCAALYRELYEVAGPSGLFGLADPSNTVGDASEFFTPTTCAAGSRSFK